MSVQIRFLPTYRGKIYQMKGITSHPPARTGPWHFAESSCSCGCAHAESTECIYARESQVHCEHLVGFKILCCL